MYTLSRPVDSASAYHTARVLGASHSLGSRGDFRYQSKPGTAIDKSIKKRIAYLLGKAYSGSTNNR